QAAALREVLGVPVKPLAGPNVNVIYNKASRVLTAAYEKRRAEKPDLKGHLELKVHVDAKGAASEVDLTDDGPGDKALAAGLKATLKEAQYPVRQTTLTFKFDLGHR